MFSENDICFLRYVICSAIIITIFALLSDMYLAYRLNVVEAKCVQLNITTGIEDDQ